MSNENECRSIEKNTTIENFQTMEELEREHIFKAMKLSGGNKPKVAKLLGITIKSVYNKLNKYYGTSMNNITNNSEGESL